jgi:A/G-specific adenine glycosylase
MLESLIKWSHREYGDLPWRKKRSLYGTLVSEIMLQQTTVSTVLKHFDRFLEVFPNLDSLANATEEEVCAQWQGLGYYRRARNLRKAAVALVEDHNGKFPKTIEELKKIPGIGDYTASALVSIGMNKSALAIDANLERVLARLFMIKEEKGPRLQKHLYKKFAEGDFDVLFKKAAPRDVNEALMDIGRVYCQARKADCHLCPLKKDCLVFQKKEKPLDFPVIKEGKNKKESHDLKLLRVVVRLGNKIFGYVKEDHHWLSGQVEIPTFIVQSSDRSLKQYPSLKIPKSRLDKFPIVKTAITKYKIENYILELDKTQFQKLIKDLETSPRYKYFKFDIQEHHFSTTTLKVLKKLGFEV